MRKSQKISAVPNLLQVLQSKLWYNDKYKLFFSTYHTNNPQEYYCFFLDIDAEVRKHAKYRLTTDGVLVTFYKTEYKVKDLENMRRYEIIMIQLTNTENELDYMNWLGIEIPVKKGLPYSLNPKSVIKHLYE